MTSRLFFALWPDPVVRQALQDTVSRLPLSGRVVPAANLHMTLVFLGAVDDTLQAELTAAATGIAAHSFTLVIDHGGWWRRPQLAWLAPRQVPDALQALVGKLTAMCAGMGVSVDRRPYHPHITIARRIARRPVWPDIQPVSWRTDRFALVQSSTLSQGAEYTVLRSWPLTCP